jgi:hypothetical protein
MKDQRHLFCLLLFALNLSACHRPGDSAVPLTSGRVPPVLLFNGTGASPNDAAAIETLLEKSWISYSTASSAQLDAMSAARLRTYHLIIAAGGDFTTSEPMVPGLRPSAVPRRPPASISIRMTYSPV